MAKLETWQMIYPLFVPHEFGPSGYENMDDDFLLSVYRFRVAMDTPMIIHEGFATANHSPNSFHYSGRAVDFHFVHRHMPIRRIIVAAIKCGLYGIGAYPHWSPYPGGFHLDNRPASAFNIWRRDENGIYHYTFPDLIPETLEQWRS